MSAQLNMKVELKALLRLVRTEFARLVPLLLLDWLVPKKKNIFLYGAFAGDLYGENSRFMFEYALKNEPQIKHYWVTANKQLYLELKRRFPENVIYAKSLQGCWTILRAKVVFVSDHITDVYYFLTKRHLIINLWHGLHWKRVGQCRKTRRHLAFSLARFFHKKKVSYLLASSTVEKFLLSKSFNLPVERVIVTGIPRNDIVNQDVLEESLADFDSYKSVVLYAPTFRHSEPPRFFPFDDFDSSELEEFLVKNNMLFILRGHRATTVSKARKLYNRHWKPDEFARLKNVQIINHDRLTDVNTLFNKCSLLITDYSTVFLDFLLTDKPLMFIPYDLEKYESEAGFLFDYDSITPGPKVNSFKDFKTQLIKLLNDKNYFAKERLFVKNLRFKYQDSCARQRIMDFVKSIV
jgi:CDP-glycerol glycerophosphotransferase